MKILGIWDGHDSGAALIENDTILFAVNEERLTRRKLEICFPEKSIAACLKYTETKPEDVSIVTCSTSDFAKTLTRLFPSLKEEYYLIRRRKKLPKISAFKKKLKYKLTEFPPVNATGLISHYLIKKQLQKSGFQSFRLNIVDHHQAHASAAAFCSGFEKSLVITLDGLGDGASGKIYAYNDNHLELLSCISSRHSLGIFFEHVTNLMNMRELEDEGKVMALANYAYPVTDQKNPLLKLIRIDGTSVKCALSSLKMYDKLKEIYWKYPSEQFAFMAQRTLEIKVLELVKNALNKYAYDHLCLAGGVFSNVKLNRLLRTLPQLKKCFVFPHMGDGGLAIGSALVDNYRLNNINKIQLDHIFLGPHYSDNEIEQALKIVNLQYTKSSKIVAVTAKKIAKGSIVFWFQGRMELGPRSLGGRSILALPDSNAIKDELNLRLKKRVWYQPFCPSMLEDDAKEILEDYDNIPNPFMTMAYTVKKSKRDIVKGTINVDGSCRPQIVGNENPLFYQLLVEIKKLTGHGIVLNTSLNIHGEPLVCSPKDAIKTMIKTKCQYLAIHNYWVEN
jgi:carbamoyltransferase